MDIIIVLDRLSIFLKKLKKLNSCYKICLIGFSITSLINLPSFFWYDVRSHQDFINCSIQFACLKTFTYCHINENIFNHYIGQIININLIFIRDITILVVEFVLSFILLINYKKYLAKRQRHLGNRYSCKKLNDNNPIKKSTKRRNTFFLDNKLCLNTIYLSISSFILHLFIFITSVLIIYFNGDIIHSNKYYFLGIFSIIFKSLVNSILFAKFFARSQ